MQVNNMCIYKAEGINLCGLADLYHHCTHCTRLNVKAEDHRLWRSLEHCMVKSQPTDMARKGASQDGVQRNSPDFSLGDGPELFEILTQCVLINLSSETSHKDPGRSA